MYTNYIHTHRRVDQFQIIMYGILIKCDKYLFTTLYNVNADTTFPLWREVGCRADSW